MNKMAQPNSGALLKLEGLVANHALSVTGIVENQTALADEVDRLADRVLALETRLAGDGRLRRAKPGSGRIANLTGKSGNLTRLLG